MQPPIAPGPPAVELFTDGACIGNPGPGGWAFILRHVASGRVREASGGEHHTTNNRMEITAAIRGLEALRRPSDVQLYSDSEYVVKALQSWLERWETYGWYRTAKRRQKVKNVDLWQALRTLSRTHRVQATWVRGHAGHPENERCDALAMTAAEKIAASPPPEPTRQQEPDQGSLF